MVKFGPPRYLVTDRGSDYISTDKAHLCTPMGIRHSPITPYSPWTNGLVGVQIKNHGTHIRMFLQNTPMDWAHHVHMYAFAHNSQPLSAINISLHELVFHIRHRIPLILDLNLNRNKNNSCILQYYSEVPEHPHYEKTDLYLTKHSQNLFHIGLSPLKLLCYKLI